MPLSFTCPNCQKQYPKLKSKLAGRKVRCRCGCEMRIPELDALTLADKPGNKRAVPQPENIAAQFENHYSDLDQILSGTASPDLPFVPRSAPSTPNSDLTSPSPQQNLRRAISPVTRTNPRSPATATVSSTSSARPSPTRKTISFVSVILGASLAFWFGALVIAARFTPFEQFPINRFTDSLSQINSASFGSAELSRGLKFGFQVSGWVMFAIAVALIVFAAVQFANAVMQLFVQRQLVRWADGLLASFAVAMTFAIVATLFLHATHTSKLNRELNQQVLSAGGSLDQPDLPNVQRLRDQYSSEGRQFMTAMLAAAAVPLTVFGCAMTRLFTK